MEELESFPFSNRGHARLNASKKMEEKRKREAVEKKMEREKSESNGKRICKKTKWKVCVCVRVCGEFKETEKPEYGGDKEFRYDLEILLLFVRTFF